MRPEPRVTTATPVNPVAALFPMLTDVELSELAADIAQRGLLHPVVLDEHGAVLDGRNRLAACQLVNITPVFTTYDGGDPDGYALAVNLQRRNLTKGQQAMIAARAMFVSNTSAGSAASTVGTSRTRIAYAVTVRDHAPDLVDGVIAGATGLDEAYKIARQRKNVADSDTTRLANLRAEDADLADRVVEGELSLKAALVELESRREEIKRQQRVATELLGHLCTVANMAGAGTAERYEPGLALPTREITSNVIDLARRAIEEIETTLKERGLL